MKKTKESSGGSRSNMFVVHGPYEVPHALIPETRKLYKVADANALAAFWKHEVGDHQDGAAIAAKDGIYIFAMRAGRGYTPWYVGKAGRSLKKEVFTPDKITDYNVVLVSTRGTPVLFFITNEGATKKHIRKEQLKRMEQDLILKAKRKNPGLKNKNLTTDPYAWHILGISGRQAKPSAAVNKFKTMMGCCTSCGA